MKQTPAKPQCLPGVTLTIKAIMTHPSGNKLVFTHSFYSRKDLLSSLVKEISDDSSLVTALHQMLTLSATQSLSRFWFLAEFFVSDTESEWGKGQQEGSSPCWSTSVRVLCAAAALEVTCLLLQLPEPSKVHGRFSGSTSRDDLGRCGCFQWRRNAGRVIWMWELWAFSKIYLRRTISVGENPTSVPRGRPSLRLPPGSS